VEIIAGYGMHESGNITLTPSQWRPVLSKIIIAFTKE
jgi:hypothetical protein